MNSWLPNSSVPLSVRWESVFDAEVRVSSVSRSRQPRWRQPSGALVEAKIGGGPLGFIKSDRTWIGIATQTTAYVFRVDDSRSEQLSATITQRTGIPVVRLK